MIDRITNNSIIISKRTIRKKGGVVILTLEEYEQLLSQTMPNYCLEGKEARGLDKLVEQGLREYQKGKSKIIKSLADLD